MATRTRKVKDAIDLNTNEPIYFTSHAKATYMSDGRNVEDAINNIEVGSESTSINSYPLVNHTNSDSTFTLTPNTFHVWSLVGELTLTLGEEIPGVMNEYLFQVEFFGGCTLSLPSNIKWANDDIPDFSDKDTYQISIVNNFATYLKFPYHSLQ